MNKNQFKKIDFYNKLLIQNKCKISRSNMMKDYKKQNQNMKNKLKVQHKEYRLINLILCNMMLYLKNTQLYKAATFNSKNQYLKQNNLTMGLIIFGQLNKHNMEM